jgi:hypothetical protein
MTVHSTVELELLRKDLVNERIQVFPLILATPGAAARFRDRQDIVFVGGFQHTPNVDAVQYFVASSDATAARACPVRASM